MQPAPTTKASSGASHADAALLLARYFEAGRAMGCVADQMRRFAEAGMVLQPKQLRASAYARMCDAPEGPTEVAMGGARGGGKTHWAFAQMGIDDCQRYNGLKWLYLRKVGKSARESFGDVIPRVFRNIPHDYKEYKGTLTFPNGSTVILGHFSNESDIDAYLGLEYDGAVIEEATTLSHSKITAIRSTVRTSKEGWRPRIYMTTNPGGVGHAWFKKRFVEPSRTASEVDTRFVPATVDDNRFINREYVKTLDDLTGWLYRAWRHGDWDIAAGQYFTNFRREVHVIAPFPIPQNWRVWGALDYGFTHYTAFYLAAQSSDGDIYIIGEHADRKQLPSYHAEQIKGMATRLVNGLGHVSGIVAGVDVFGKQRSDKTIADDYAACGIELERAVNDRVTGATRLLSLLGDADKGIRPRLFVFDTCARLIETLPTMEHDPHRPEDVLKVDTDDDGNGGDDFYDAARYLVMAAGSGMELRREGSPLGGYRG